MGLEGASTEALARSKTDYETFLADPENLKLVREKLATEGVTAEQKHVLQVIDLILCDHVAVYHASVTSSPSITFSHEGFGDAPYAPHGLTRGHPL